MSGIIKGKTTTKFYELSDDETLTKPIETHFQYLLSFLFWSVRAAIRRVLLKTIIQRTQASTHSHNDSATQHKQNEFCLSCRGARKERNTWLFK